MFEMKKTTFRPFVRHAAPLHTRHNRAACFLDINSQEYKDLVEKFGADAAKEMNRLGSELEQRLNVKFADIGKGNMTTAEFNTFKTTELAALNTQLKKMDDETKETLRLQGLEINKLVGKASEGSAAPKTLRDYLEGEIPKIKALRAAGAGFYEITSDDLIKAGVVTFNMKAASSTSTTSGTVGGTNGSVVDMVPALGSPYLPGLGGTDLQLFEIVRNPNFITNRVNVGSTNQSRLAWINEVDYQGTPGTAVAEMGTKPLTQHKFQVEYSIAKKAAAYVILTEEFEEDLPGLATAVRRMLQADVLRTFDDAIQTAVIAIARPYEITGLDAKVPFTTLFDAMGAMLAQIGFYNFVPNTIALNPVTSWQAMMDKDAQGRYLNPPFIDRINNLLVEATKVAVGFGLTGDLSQYNVDIYKQFTLRIGWINDQIITNQFCVVGELRYHNYISDTRKKAICYNQLLAVQQKITAGS